MIRNTEILTKVLHIPGVGSKTGQKILSRVKEQNLRDDEDLIESITQIFFELNLTKLLHEIKIRDAFHKAEQVLEANDRMGIKMTCIFDDDYPERLKRFKSNPPALLNYKGDISSIKENPSCAVIGTREPTGNGYSVGVRIGELLAENKVIVVSGLARGCDTAGHTGCLNKNGKTIAVLAHGLNHLYPKENRKLADEIVDKGGALLTEYFFDQTARNNFFVERDRIQAGLSDNIFVVETGVKGGTMHTVKFALENHKKVFTYKHPKKYQNEDKAQGNQMLIKEEKATGIGNAQEFNDFLLYIFNNKSLWINRKIHFAGSFLLGTATKPTQDYDIDLTINKPDSNISQPDTTQSTPKKKRKPKVNQIIKDLTDKKESKDQEKNKGNNSQMNLWE
jgi:DNA processing protein